MAREAVQRGVVALGHDLGSALGLSRSVKGHPLLRTALERAGELVASDAALDAIESSLASPQGNRGLAFFRTFLA